MICGEKLNLWIYRYLFSLAWMATSSFVQGKLEGDGLLLLPGSKNHKFWITSCSPCNQSDMSCSLLESRWKVLVLHDLGLV